MKKLGAILMILSLLFFVGCGLSAAQGVDKYTNYNNSETYPELNQNAYVGGDAYNYIINGTYFTAFTVISAACAISGLMCLIGGALLISRGKTQEQLNACKQLLEEIADQHLTAPAAKALPGDGK